MSTMPPRRRPKTSTARAGSNEQKFPYDTVVMSGGAPHSPLMAGFLHAMLDHDPPKMFNYFHTAGAGALIALLVIAPARKSPSAPPDPKRALRRWSEVGVADEIYNSLPINYKIFSKPGPFAPIIRKRAQYYHIPDRADADGDEFQRRYRRWVRSWYDTRSQGTRRVFNDLVDLWFSVITPSTLTSTSEGLAAPVPFLEEIIDFDVFKKIMRTFSSSNERRFWVNAFDMNTQSMEIFENESITASHIRAAFSMPFIYPPQKLRVPTSGPTVNPPTFEEHYFSEGADHEPLNFRGLGAQMARLVTDTTTKPLVVLDIMGTLGKCLVRRPRNLWDAYVISIMTPIVSLAKKDELYFEEVTNKGGQFALEKVTFDIPPKMEDSVVDWSYSNMQHLFAIGEIAGMKFLAQHAKDVPPFVPGVFQ